MLVGVVWVKLAGSGALTVGRSFDDEGVGGGGESADLGVDGVVEAGAAQPSEQFVGSGELYGVASANCHVSQCCCSVCLAAADSQGDSLQQLRAVLPCEVRVVAETHPLVGRLLAAKSFKRWNGVLLLVIDLPDGSPGTIRCDATDVLGVVEPGPRAVLNGAGLRALHRLVVQMATRAEVGVSGVGAQVGSPRP